MPVIFSNLASDFDEKWESKDAMKILISSLDSCKYYVITLLTVIFLEIALSNLKAEPAPVPRPLIKPRHPTVQIAWVDTSMDFTRYV